VGCHLRTSRHGYLAFQLRWNGLRSWEGTQLRDTAANRARLEKVVRLIDAEIGAGSFEYLRFFPNGNKAALFHPQDKEVPSPKTFANYYAEWIGRQGPPRVKPSTVAFYRYAIGGKVLPRWKSRSIESIVGADLQALQTNLYALGLSAATVNRVVHGALRPLLRDARRDDLLAKNPYEAVRPLREEPKESIDPYTPEERDRILAGFRVKRAVYYPLACFQFFTGARPSEAFALRWGKVDLERRLARIDRSRTGSYESYTKTVKSRRYVRLHSIVTEALRDAKPLDVSDETPVFRTPAGVALDIRNFYQREWVPMLNDLEIRLRPFYNTRHTYISFAMSLGEKLAFVCSQTGTSPAMIERHYGCYFLQTGDGDLLEAALGGGRNVKPDVKPSELADPAFGETLLNSVAKTEASERATRRNRTGDLLITNQLLYHLS